jgi:hypothetical protein
MERHRRNRTGQVKGAVNIAATFPSTSTGRLVIRMVAGNEA